ncbi:MAG: UDP-galactose-lipid carrier transferase [Myxococcaceae bacterium]|nr:UDP-galactose-lipid carrier transferase [Myxococcaceae bacterium]MEA2752728.1 AMP-polyphosphate phosphotransferase [Myxococcales bacterium]
MFESAELGHKIDDAAYDKQTKKLRPELLEAQYGLLRCDAFPVIVLVNGVDGAGKGETVNLLNEWLDPRHIRSIAFGPRTEEEKMRPPMWRFWRALPAKGKIGALFGNWYTDPINGRVEHKLRGSQLAPAIERIRRFERLLNDDGALIVKLWFHLSKKGMKKRLEELASNKLTSWRVTKDDWENLKRYDSFAKVSERVLRETSTGDAPWVVIDGSDPNYRAVTAAKTLLGAINGRLTEARAGTVEDKRAARRKRTGAADASTEAAPVFEAVDTSLILKELKFEERLSKEKYQTKIVKVQGELAKLTRTSKMSDHSVIVVFEGMDAAGKGGAIRRVTGALDARQYDVVPVAAPTDEERAQPYLWRFWKNVPRLGRLTIFDRSWYGRVLVERVEGFATQASWTRGYAEINDFEEQLTEAGAIVVKVWLAITKEEQLRRFKEREKTKFKQYKITPDDWRNRKKWDEYITAGGDMIDRTSTSFAPWHIIEANDKHLARVRVIEAISGRMKAAFDK